MADWRARLPTKRREFKRLLRLLHRHLHELENYVLWPSEVAPGEGPLGNMAVVVLRDGRAFVGHATREEAKGRRKICFNMAVGRALKRASMATWERVLDPGDFGAPMLEGDVPIGGVELRDYCRQQVGL